MPVPITAADLGSDRVRVSLWYVCPGEHVYEGDRVVELLIPGATFDVASPATGVIAECLALNGDRVGVGCVLGTIEPET
jgi:pyruvate/2-oxoglutarate dehydrogenase complex dihydrolipoamide acyltransferase (E2) component